MINPLSVKIDHDHEVGPIAYVLYSDAKIMGTRRVNESVAYDYAEDNVIVGVELLDLDPDTLATGKQVADNHGLAFPKYLSVVAA